MRDRWWTELSADGKLYFFRVENWSRLLCTANLQWFYKCSMLTLHICILAPTFCGNPGITFILQVLVAFKLVEETPQIHIAVEVLVLLWGINAGVWRWGCSRPARSTHKSLRSSDQLKTHDHIAFSHDKNLERVSGGVTNIFAKRESCYLLPHR